MLSLHFPCRSIYSMCILLGQAYFYVGICSLKIGNMRWVTNMPCNIFSPSSGNPLPPARAFEDPREPPNDRWVSKAQAFCSDCEPGLSIWEAVGCQSSPSSLGGFVLTTSNKIAREHFRCYELVPLLPGDLLHVVCR